MVRKTHNFCVADVAIPMLQVMLQMLERAETTCLMCSDTCKFSRSVSHTLCVCVCVCATLEVRLGGEHLFPHDLETFAKCRNH